MTLLHLGVAKDIGDLQDLLEEAVRLCGTSAHWLGQDDGSIVIYGQMTDDNGSARKEEGVYITREPIREKAQQTFVCQHCGNEVTATSQPHCNVCDWKPMMKLKGAIDAQHNTTDEQ
jgi:DNA-directed RNA polymerase subunit RPC12/RpoP